MENTYINPWNTGSDVQKAYPAKLVAEMAICETCPMHAKGCTAYDRLSQDSCPAYKHRMANLSK